MTTTGGMQCICSDTMAATCTLPPDAAGSWAPMMLVVAIGYLLWLKQHDEDRPRLRHAPLHLRVG